MRPDMGWVLGTQAVEVSAAWPGSQRHTESEVECLGLVRLQVAQG